MTKPDYKLGARARMSDPRLRFGQHWQSQCDYGSRRKILLPTYPFSQTSFPRLLVIAIHANSYVPRACPKFERTPTAERLFVSLAGRDVRCRGKKKGEKKRMQYICAFAARRIRDAPRQWCSYRNRIEAEALKSGRLRDRWSRCRHTHQRAQCSITISTYPYVPAVTVTFTTGRCYTARLSLTGATLAAAPLT